MAEIHLSYSFIDANVAGTSGLDELTRGKDRYVIAHVEDKSRLVLDNDGRYALVSQATTATFGTM